MASTQGLMIIADIGGYTTYMRTHRMSLAHVERQYVAHNLCPCGGCKEAEDLTLTFVAHVGEVATQRIRDRLKLVGTT
ncbi:DUF2652 domain-containing protein [Nocardioides KLBMP 9356]|uniref:DUF2652 domain-containing protein n=1 Tax=Nocardioides potassii TaxID=2911371 RepID=A0ABS9HG96_9ACTN|nr:DUF2652 domain-containing protein [Nocardioides potassii]MCF6379128.1 DUF2652 domain-containing protein [Nocardioides potassii]